ncbi:MAG: YihA family ribosome biogenesis GTP-binding protein [Ignavibacteriae bacterium HGW-Ignavibacteriae-2]|jgi:GTP-binding protein|nr:ribosome biogenesis GTP-binding protein YihA/YsxC [Bacteroidota bacterium]PKL89045.1 MAG: YihA family ribosome biogenesis GTP-binding protein [Ignavibacteriae bacterium HGW-Ignavibacteriae-2]
MFDDIKFIKSASTVNGLPERKLPEIILCGRSNVGKSSFINSFFRRKEIAKISSSPGKTRLLNYYLVDDKFYIVDLPGFGYAKVSKKERDEWQQLINDYLQQSGNIVRAFHFIDSRHEPTKLDMLLHTFLEDLEIPCNYILTKVDKLKQSEIVNAKRYIKNAFGNVKIGTDVILYSSVKGTGRKEVLSVLNEIFM